MLHPDFNELVALKFKAEHLGINSHRNASSPLAGSYSSSFRGQGIEFEEVRQYVPGDDVRNIDWRVTARTGTPHLKIFREERERSVIICVDATAKMRFGTRGTFKSIQAARAAALLGWSANHQHDRVGALVFGDVPGGVTFFKPTRTRHSMWQMFRLLSSEKVIPDIGNHQITDAISDLCKVSHTGSLVFLIGDFTILPANFERELARLSKKCEVVLVPVNDPADRYLPPSGDIVFIGKDGKGLNIDTGNTKGAEKYEAEWQENQARLKKICSALNINIIEINTNSDVHRSLLEGLAAKGRKRAAV